MNKLYNHGIDMNKLGGKIRGYLKLGGSVKKKEDNYVNRDRKYLTKIYENLVVGKINRKT